VRWEESIAPETSLGRENALEPPERLNSGILPTQAIIRKSGMVRNKTLRQRISTLKRRVQLHEDKKRREWRKERPELGLIEHWQTEIDNWKEQIRHIEDRLKKRR
jgi:hypothetical protein